MHANLDDHARAGQRLVWVVDPATRTVTILGAAGPARLRPGDTLHGGAVAPGLRCDVGALFGGPGGGGGEKREKGEERGLR